MKFQKHIKIILAICLLLAFAILSKYEDRQVIRSMDFAATVKVQDKIDKSVHLRLAALVDNTMEGATFFASPLFSTIVVLLLTIFCFRKFGIRSLIIPLLFLLLTGGEVFGKSVVHHPSPPFSMIKHTTSVFPANYINEQFSYPSGHAARAVFISCLIYLLLTMNYLLGDKTKKISVLVGLFIYVLLVGVSRIYLGHHWLSDVMGGGLLGSGLGLLTLTANSHIIT